MSAGVVALSISFVVIEAYVQFCLEMGRPIFASLLGHFSRRIVLPWLSFVGNNTTSVAYGRQHLLKRLRWCSNDADGYPNQSAEGWFRPLAEAV